MAKRIDDRGDPGRLVIQAERHVSGRTERFNVIVEEDVWEDLYHVNGPDGPAMTVEQAYELDRPFLDALAEGLANAGGGEPSPEARRTHERRYTLRELEEARRRFRS
ncbi:MAG TPA: hypothetical protein VFG47_17320 [Geminicoccaceae bacterium]|nr:hypothetical protein [Geminicoccaceae bacterium]